MAVTPSLWSLLRRCALCVLTGALLVVATTPCQRLHAALVESTDADTVRLDSARSQVNFSVKVMWLMRISGHFAKIDGKVHLDHFRNEVSVDARIDVDSVSMSNDTYERWVKSPEFFDVAKYPQIEFASESIAQSRLRKGGNLPGMLTMHGIRRAVTFTLDPSACEHPAYDCPIKVEGAIERSDFGMRSRRAALSDKVHLSFSVYARPTAAKRP